jgi:hypothetical protein
LEPVIGSSEFMRRSLPCKTGCVRRKVTLSFVSCNPLR